VLDIASTRVDEIGPDRVRVTGSRGKQRPDRLKATVCVDGGVLGEAEISYAGPNAMARARLAAEVINERMSKRAPGLRIRTDAIGAVSVLGNNSGLFSYTTNAAPDDIRLRFAAQSDDLPMVEMLLDEVEALYCAGPAGGAGVRRRLTPRLASASCLIEREFVKPRVIMLGDNA